MRWWDAGVFVPTQQTVWIRHCISISIDWDEVFFVSLDTKISLFRWRQRVANFARNDIPCTIFQTIQGIPAAKVFWCTIKPENFVFVLFWFLTIKDNGY